MDDKIYWLIEAPGPAYLYAAARIFGWTLDVDRALHLATEEQAETLMMAVREHRPDLFPAAFARPPRAVEHMWVSRTENGSEPRE